MKVDADLQVRLDGRQLRKLRFDERAHRGVLRREVLESAARLLVLSGLFALVFLLVPFVAIRGTWRALPRKGVSAVYFAALGFGFMFFEVTMIQRLILFLGYPTYSLTVVHS